MISTTEPQYDMSHPMEKPTICICENKDADQLRGNREADQRLCFRYTDSTLPVLLKSEISSILPASVTIQPALCRTCSEDALLVFPRDGSYIGCYCARNNVFLMKGRELGRCIKADTFLFYIKYDNILKLTQSKLHDHIRYKPFPKSLEYMATITAWN